MSSALPLAVNNHMAARPFVYNWRLDMFSTLTGIVTFRSSIYRQVAQDPEAFKSAIFVIFLNIMATIAAMLIKGMGEIGLGIIIAIAVITHFINLLIDSTFIYVIANELGGQSSVGELFRIFGHVYIFQWLSFIPSIGPIVADLLYLVGVVIAVRESTGLSIGKAILTCIIVRAILFFIYSYRYLNN